jgi:hypothetical protein
MKGSEDMANKKTTAKPDITITNSGSGFYGIHGESVRGRKWVNRVVQGASDGVAWTDDMRMAMDIADGATACGLRVK